MHVIRPDGCGAILHHRQRHHLAANLRKPLHPAKDADEPVSVDVDDIAGIMPAINQLLDGAGVGRAKIAQHDVRPADMQAPALRHALHRHELRLHARHQPANRTRTVVLPLVRRDHGRGLGRAIAFEDLDIELAAHIIARLVLHPLCAADGKADRIHVAIRAGAGVLRDERVSCQQDRRAALADAPDDFLRLQR